jgi:hypothetical protein
MSASDSEEEESWFEDDRQEEAVAGLASGPVESDCADFSDNEQVGASLRKRKRASKTARKQGTQGQWNPIPGCQGVSKKVLQKRLAQSAKAELGGAQ